MHKTMVLLGLLAVGCLHAQDRAKEGFAAQSPVPTPMPTLTLSFSSPDLDSPLELPSGGVIGPPLCGPGGRAFMEFLTPPPIYVERVVYSISPAGKVVNYRLSQLNGIVHPSIVSFDPGSTEAVMLLRGSAAGQPGPGAVGFYMVLFGYDGTVEDYRRLDLGFEPMEILQLSGDTFLALGEDMGEAQARFAVIDDRGEFLRNLGEDPAIPKSQDLAAALASIHTTGQNTSRLPPSQKLATGLSLLKPAHSEHGLLLLLPGAEARVIELLRDGTSQVVKLRLPKGQFATSVFSSNGKWFVRTYPEDDPEQSNLYKVNPETGDAEARIDTSGVPATSIGCPTESGFFGLRWIKGKPYQILGQLK